MKTVVLVKVVKGEINPFDACAVEAALQIADNDITIISMSPKSNEPVLKSLTRLGVDNVIMLSDSRFAGSDTLATSYILSTAIKRINPDLVICGRQSIDGDTAQVGPGVSAFLKYSLITNVMEIYSINTKSISCRTRAGDESAGLPSVITVERINNLRFPSIRSKTREVVIWDNNILHADVTRCGLQGSPTRVLKTIERTRKERKCKFINREELLPLIDRLKNIHKKRAKSIDLSVKFDEIWCVGDELMEYAGLISHSVKILPRGDINNIIAEIRSKKPEVVLWPNDIWGRKNAPVAAVNLNTGLCADCTELDIENDKLVMYRPADSGNITAKIICNSIPQMATVHVKSETADIIVAGGKGVAHNIDQLKQFASSFGAQLCSSRTLVDTGYMPYESQVGLTGKMVSPKIYIAVGISGSIQHTCAIEFSDTVIAINPDKNAPIFNYSDYGIVGEF